MLLTIFYFDVSTHKKISATNKDTRHQWSSGRIVPCHGTDPGSIPGWCINFSFFEDPPKFQSHITVLLSRFYFSSHLKGVQMKVHTGS